MFVSSVVSVPAWSRYIFVKRLRWICSLLMVLGFFFSVVLFLSVFVVWLFFGLVEITLYDKAYRLLFEVIFKVVSYSD